MPMKPAREWNEELQAAPPDREIEFVQGRSGEPTLKAGAVYLHSRYNPCEEAVRFVDSANLDPQRPVLVIGLGLGYHVQVLLERKMDVAVVEPNLSVARFALGSVLKDSDVLLALGDADLIGATESFRKLARRIPQVLVHPPTARIHPGFADAVTAQLAKAGLAGQRLSVAVVGPMFGGSLPIAGYLERAFRSLGHRTLLVGNDIAWDLYDRVSQSVRTKKAADQLQGVLSHFLNEWCYARVAEFGADICIVLAQAPVGVQFPVRLANEGVVTAFWYVENWRHLTYWRDIARFYDCFFHIQPGEFEEQLTEAGCRNHACVPTGCDPEIHRPVELSESERAEFACDVSFAGAGYYNRLQVFKGLTDYNFKIWGVEWSARELLPLVQRPDERFTPEFFARIVAGSKININLHSSQQHTGVDPDCDAINPRVFEIAACGGFQLCDPCKGLDRFFDPESELPTYRNVTELRARIDHYLSHPEERRQIAERARARALRDHTYAARADQMLGFILNRFGSRILSKGIRMQRTIGEIAERAGRDTELGRYLTGLPADELFTQENLNARIAPTGVALTYPEAVFAYLREMRNHAEALLAAKE